MRPPLADAIESFRRGLYCSVRLKQAVGVIVHPDDWRALVAAVDRERPALVARQIARDPEAPQTFKYNGIRFICWTPPL